VKGGLNTPRKKSKRGTGKMTSKHENWRPREKGKISIKIFPHRWSEGLEKQNNN